MIVLEHVTKSYRAGASDHVVLRDISCRLNERENLGILGANGAGKSTLLRILAGVEQPDGGKIARSGRISWPIGFSGGFNGSLSGEENCRFVARIYGEDVDEVVGFTREFAELGKYFELPVRTYSSGMRARLAFGLSMAIDFDVYLVDEVTAVGDARFQERCRAEFAARRNHSSVIIVSHQMQTLKEYADHVRVLKDGQLTMYDDLSAANAAYRS